MLLNQQPKAEAFFDTWLLETCKYNELEHLQPLEPPRTIAGPKIARPGGAKHLRRMKREDGFPAVGAPQDSRQAKSD